MNVLKELRRAAVVTIWFIILTFPIMIMRVNTVTDTIEWRWGRLIFLGASGFIGTLIWSMRGTRQRAASAETEEAESNGESVERALFLDRVLARFNLTRDSFRTKRFLVPFGIIITLLAAAYPFTMSLYQTHIMISALIYVILALGLNIVIGLGGMLHLGYAAFYAVGAYTYGLLNFYFGIGFWIALPIAAAVSTIFGILLAIPVLRLRGDYLAIVTLAFGEIIRIILINWADFSQGPGGVKGISRPGFFGVEFSYRGSITFIYFICIAIVLLTIFIVNRLENSRIGRQLVAMGEDDIAAQAMGVNTVKAKLTAFALGAVWAGLAGVLFASKTTLINPNSFRVWESVLILCMVVLGGMGSIPGVIIGALILILMPEYLRAFSEYRLLLFGAILVIMMLFRPGGLIPKRRKVYKLKPEQLAEDETIASNSGTGGQK